MTAVTRYNFRSEGMSDPPEACESDSGDWVDYGDYAALLSSHDAQAAEIERLREALQTIEGIASGSTTANSLPHIAKIARAALGEKHD